MSPTTPDLVERAQAGHNDAREALMRDWTPTVLAWCMRLSGPKVDAHDAAQDVMIQVLKRMDRLHDPVAFPAWIFGVTRRVLANHRRKAWVRRWASGAVPDGVDPGIGPERRAEQSQTSRLVQQALERLPAEQREVLVLCDLEERSTLEVADLLGVPQGTVKSRLRLGRLRLKRVAEHMSLQPTLSVVKGGRS